MGFVIYTVDDSSGFQTEHAAFLEKLVDYKTSIESFEIELFNATQNEDRAEAEEKLMASETDKFTKQQAFLEFKKTLISKIIEVKGTGESVEDEMYFLLLPDDANELTEVIFYYV